jgi:hypothetical protein
MDQADSVGVDSQYVDDETPDDEWGRELIFGTAQLGRSKYDFYLVYQAEDIQPALGIAPFEPAVRPGDRELARRLEMKNRLRVAEALEAAIVEAAPGIEARATVDFEQGVRTAGPGLGGEVLRFFVSDDPLGRLADLISILGAVKAAKGWLEGHQSAAVRISDGVAILLAADALTESRGILDVSVHYCAPLDDLEDGYSTVGFLVGLRHADGLTQVVVGASGRVGAIEDIDLKSVVPPDQGTRA